MIGEISKTNWEVSSQVKQNVLSYEQIRVSRYSKFNFINTDFLQSILGSSGCVMQSINNSMNYELISNKIVLHCSLCNFNIPLSKFKYSSKCTDEIIIEFYKNEHKVWCTLPNTFRQFTSGDEHMGVESKSQLMSNNTNINFNQICNFQNGMS